MAKSILSAATLLLLLAASAAARAEAPPIKPGLWEVRTATDKRVSGMLSPVPRLDGMSAEQQARALRLQDVRKIAGPDRVYKVCLTPETLASGQWRGEEGTCTTSVKDKSDKAWAWHSVCRPQMTEIDAAATFRDAENYVVNNAMQEPLNGHPTSSRNQLEWKWVSADCGRVTP